MFRADLSDALRQPLIDILRRSCATPFLADRIERLFNPFGLDTLPARSGQIALAEEEHRPEFIAVKRLLLGCEWFQLYDLIEDVWRHLTFHDAEWASIHDAAKAPAFEQAVNDYFVQARIGWQLVKGEIVTRGTDAFESAVREAASVATETRRSAAAGHIRHALADLSRRPHADVASALAHALGALEDLVPELPDDLQLTPGESLMQEVSRFVADRAMPLPEVVSRIADHVKRGTDGRDPTRQEVEWLVGFAAHVARYVRHDSP